MSDSELLLMKSITKRFPGDVALSQVTFRLEQGEIQHNTIVPGCVTVQKSGSGKLVWLPMQGAAIFHALRPEAVQQFVRVVGGFQKAEKLSE